MRTREIEGVGPLDVLSCLSGLCVAVETTLKMCAYGREIPSNAVSVTVSCIRSSD